MRGVSIIAVVAIHALGPASETPVESFGYEVALVARQLINFAVPMFLALAGYMAGGRPVGPAGQFWATRLGRLLPPYLFWTGVYIVLLKRGDLFSPAALFADVFMGAGIGIGYFVIVLAQMVLLTPLIARVRSRVGHIAMIIGGAAIGLAWTYVFRLAFPDLPFDDFPQSGLPFWVWYPFYHVGFLAARERLTTSSALQKALPMIALAWLALVAISLAEGYFLAHAGAQNFAVSQTKLSSVLASLAAFAAVISAFPRLRRAPKLGLDWLGRSSYFVYLTHLLVFAVLGRAFSMAGIAVDPVLYAIVLIPVTIAICCCGIATLRFLPSKLTSIVLG